MSSIEIPVLPVESAAQSVQAEFQEGHSQGALYEGTIALKGMWDAVKASAARFNSDPNGVNNALVASARAQGDMFREANRRR